MPVLFEILVTNAIVAAVLALVVFPGNTNVQELFCGPFPVADRVGQARDAADLANAGYRLVSGFRCCESGCR